MHNKFLIVHRSLTLPLSLFLSLYPVLALTCSFSLCVPGSVHIENLSICWAASAAATVLLCAVLRCFFALQPYCGNMSTLLLLVAVIVVVAPVIAVAFVAVVLCVVSEASVVF